MTEPASPISKSKTAIPRKTSIVMSFLFKLARLTGLEPATRCLEVPKFGFEPEFPFLGVLLERFGQGSCSVQLSYRRTTIFYSSNSDAEASQSVTSNESRIHGSFGSLKSFSTRKPPDATTETSCVAHSHMRRAASSLISSRVGT